MKTNQNHPIIIDLLTEADAKTRKGTHDSNTCIVCRAHRHAEFITGVTHGEEFYRVKYQKMIDLDSEVANAVWDLQHS